MRLDKSERFFGLSEIIVHEGPDEMDGRVAVCHAVGVNGLEDRLEDRPGSGLVEDAQGARQVYLVNRSGFGNPDCDGARFVMPVQIGQRIRVGQLETDVRLMLRRRGFVERRRLFRLLGEDVGVGGG